MVKHEHGNRSCAQYGEQCIQLLADVVFQSEGFRFRI